MKGVIYSPRGNAKEYGDLALNLYKGCSHGCTYCYAPSATFNNRISFTNSVTPKKDIIERLEKQLKSLDKKGEERLPVFMSFTCDTYQPIDKDLMLTRQAIKLLNKYGFPVNILTKAKELAQRDFDILALNKDNSFGVTMHLWNQPLSLEWEPNAEVPVGRLDNLVSAKKAGIKTWVSIEPIVDVDQALNVIDVTAEFSDFYGIGKLNYNKHQKTIDWADALKRIKEKLNFHKKDHVIHESLLEFEE